MCDDGVVTCGCKACKHRRQESIQEERLRELKEEVEVNRLLEDDRVAQSCGYKDRHDPRWKARQVARRTHYYSCSCPVCLVPVSSTRSKKVVYLIGSMANENIPSIAMRLTEAGFEVFAEWFSPGPDADTCWQAFSEDLGRTYKEALNSYHAQEVFEFDKRHLDRCDVGVLVLPAGKSGHMELGYLAGKEKPCYVLFDKEPERYDVMYRFANDVVFSVDELVEVLR